MKEAFRFFKKYYNYDLGFYLYLISTIGTKLIILITPYVIKLLIDQVQFKDWERFKFFTIILVIKEIVFSILLATKYYFKNKLELSAINNLRQSMLKSIFSFKYEFLKNMETGQVIQKVFNDTDTAKPLIIGTIVDSILNILYGVSIIGIMFSMNKFLTLVLVCLMPVFIWFYKIYVPKIEASSSEIIKQDEQVKSLAEEVLSGSLDIKVNNAQKYMKEKIEDKFNKYLRLSLKKIRYIMEYDYILITGIMNIATLTTYCLGGYLVLKDIITMGTLTAFTLYFSKLWDPVEYFMELSKEVKVQILSVNRIKEFLDIRSEEGKSGSDLPKLERVSFKEVQFSYGERIIFSNLNLDIKAKETIAISGGNGSGKSTFASILTKLNEGYTGEIYYNNLDYREIDSTSLRKKIVFVPSKTFLFNGTIEENITLNSKKKIRDELIEGLNLKVLMNILKKNNRTLDTVVNNKSNNLSGGEQKIVQILRSLALDGDLYIFDEPLNYVDKNYRKVLIDFIDNNMKDKAVIIISHDEDIFRCCDKIYNLNNRLLSILD